MLTKRYADTIKGVTLSVCGALLVLGVFAFVTTPVMTRADASDPVPTPTPTPTDITGSITVCKILVDAVGVPITGSASSTFSISLSHASTSMVVSFDTPLTLDSHIFNAETNDGQCRTLSTLTMGNWTYGEESITSPLDFAAPLYSDQFTKKATSVSDLYQFGSGNDDADSAINLTNNSKDRTLLMYNKLIATPTPTPTPTEEVTPTPTPTQESGGGGTEPTPTPTLAGGNGPIAGSLSTGGGNGPIAGSLGGTTGGQVLGASTTTLPELPAGCSALLHSYMRLHKKDNDPAEVKKLQEFLNAQLHVSLPPTGIFDAKTDKAVRDFQSAHTDQILTPWRLSAPTGFVYLTTERWINLMACATLDLPLPTLVPYQGE